VFHVFSPSQDTQPIGKGLFDGLVKGFADSSGDLSAFEKLGAAIKSCLAALEKDTYNCGKALMAALAKGITDGSSLVKAAVEKIGITLGVVNAGAAAAGTGAKGGKGGVELKHELLEVARLSDQRLTQVVTLLNANDAILTHDFALVTAELVLLPALLRTVGTDLSGRVEKGDTLLGQQLSLDRLKLTEARAQTELLRQMYAQSQKPQTLTLKPAPGGSSPNAANAASVAAAAFASTVLG
jgi:hypothetical protein